MVFLIVASKCRSCDSGFLIIGIYQVEPSEDDDAALGTEGVEMKPWRRLLSINQLNNTFAQDLLKTIFRIVVFRSDKLEDIIGEVKRSFPGGVTA